MLSIGGINAQKPLTVNEDSIPFGNAMYPGIVVTIPETNKGIVKFLVTIAEQSRSAI